MGIKYVKAFDGLRGVAVLMLFLYHFPGQYLFIRHGWEFMQMFFVMSGYLITLTLLEDREKYPFREYSVNFYIKRALRLFPLYFAYIFACLIFYALFPGKEITRLTVADVAYHAKYLLTFTFNYMQFINEALGKSYESTIFTRHLWTISLEEQFYLLFPLVFFFFDIKAIKRIVLGAIIIAPVFRLVFFIYLQHSNPDVVWASINLSRIPFAQMDSLAMGSALALFSTGWIKNAMRWWLSLLALIVLVYMANMYYVYKVQGLDYYQVTFGLKIAERWITHNYLFTYLITLVNMWCALTLLCVVRSEWIKPWLEIKPLVFLGRLSYGIYILHLPILQVIILAHLKIFGVYRMQPYLIHELAMFAFYFMTVVFIAYISFTYFESYFLRMKGRWKKSVPVHEPAA